jgi:hypothetical protein
MVSNSVLPLPFDTVASTVALRGEDRLLANAPPDRMEKAVTPRESFFPISGKRSMEMPTDETMLASIHKDWDVNVD